MIHLLEALSFMIMIAYASPEHILIRLCPLALLSSVELVALATLKEMRFTIWPIWLRDRNRH